MQVYQRFEQLLHCLEPALVLADRDFTTCLAALTQALLLHPRHPAALPHLIAILPEMRLASAFALPDLADLYALLVCAAQQLPELSHELSEQVLGAAVVALSSISAEVGEDWSRPESSSEDGLDCECAELRVCKEIVEKVAEFAVTIGHRLARAYLAPVFRKHLQSGSDWRYEYGAVLVAAQLVEEAEEVSEVGGFVEAALPLLHHPHPKMRYAVLELLGQAGEHLRPAFQEAYFEAAVPEVLRLLWEETPRVAAHALACLSHFFLDLRPSWRVAPVLPGLIAPLLHHLRRPHPFLQLCALDLLASLAALRNSLGSSAGALVQACGEVLQQSQLLKSQEMMEEALESLAVLLSSQEEQQVGGYVPQFVASLLASHEALSDEAFLRCWSELCRAYRGFVSLEATGLVGLLVDKARRLAEQGIGEATLLGLEALSSTFSAFGAALRPYVLQLYQFCTGILSDEEHELSVRNRAIALVVELLLATKPAHAHDEAFLAEAMNLLQLLVEKGDASIEAEGEPHLLQGVLGGIIALVEPLQPKLNEHVVLTLSDRLMAYRQRIEELTAVQQAEEGEEEEEEEEGGEGEPTQATNDADSSFEGQSEDSDFSASELLDIAELIPEAYSRLMAVSEPPLRRVLIALLVPQIPFAMGKGEEWKPFALSLALALVEGCSYEDLQPYWGDLTALFLSFSAHPTVQLRNPSVYGVGVVFEKIPAALVSGDNVAQWLRALGGSLEAGFEPGEERSSIGHCADNAVAALGKLLRSYGRHFPQILTREVYQKWLSALPLRHDEQERSKQHEILLEALACDPSLLLADAGGLRRVLQVIADYLLLGSEGRSEEEALAKTRECINRMAGWEVFRRCSDSLWEGLSAGQKSALSRLISPC